MQAFIVNLDLFDQLGGQGVKVGVQAKLPNLVFNMPISSVSNVSSLQGRATTISLLVCLCKSGKPLRRSAVEKGKTFKTSLCSLPKVNNPHRSPF